MFNATCQRGVLVVFIILHEDHCKLMIMVIARCSAKFHSICLRCGIIDGENRQSHETKLRLTVEA